MKQLNLTTIILPLMIVFFQQFASAQIIATGGLHSLIICADSTLTTWGSNEYGQLYDSSAVKQRAVPIQVIGQRGIVDIASSGNHTLVLKNDGTVWASGQNDYGQLGDGTTTFTKFNPVKVVGLTNVVAVKAGIQTNFALKSDGTVWIWGKNCAGNWADTTLYLKIPVQLKGINDIIAIDGYSGYFTVVLKKDGTVWAWGDNSSGQLGDSTTVGKKYPVQVIGLSDIVAICAGYNASVALKKDGTVWEWGSILNAPQIIAKQVSGISNVKAIAYKNHALALKNDGTVWGWGKNTYGQLGDGSTIQRLSPVQMKGIINAKAISCSGSHSLILKNDNTLWACGYNNAGQLGDGTYVDRVVPVKVLNICPSPMPPITKFLNPSRIAVGEFMAMALCQDSTIMAWGNNIWGQFGNGTTKGSLFPIKIQGQNQIVSIANGDTHSLILKRDGTVWGAGTNSAGQLGDGTKIDRSNFVQALGLDHIVAIRVANDRCVALKNDGTVWVWGAEKLTPYRIENLTHVTDIAVGFAFFLALKNDGTVWGWGDNSYGQLSTLQSTLGPTPIVKYPGMILNLNNIVSVYAGYGFSMALKSDGTLWAWGDNTLSQLGDSTTINRFTPVKINSIMDVVAIAGGDYHTTALKKDGTVWAWGLNGYGQLGDGTKVNKNFPVQMSGINNAVGIATNRHNTQVLKQNGTVWTTGYYDALGDGTVNDQTIPVQAINLCYVGSDSIVTTVPNQTTLLKNRIYPNPNNGVFTLELTTNAQVLIYNVLGEVIFKQHLQQGKHELTIPLISPGIYLINIIDNNTHQTIRLIKQ